MQARMLRGHECWQECCGGSGEAEPRAQLWGLHQPRSSCLFLACICPDGLQLDASGCFTISSDTKHALMCLPGLLKASLSCALLFVTSGKSCCQSAVKCALTLLSLIQCSSI